MTALDLHALAPASFQAMGALAETVTAEAERAGLDPGLLELVRIRASQLNGCSFCLDLHTRQALVRGETPQRLDGLATWHGSDHFGRREQAALALTEAVTLISDGPVSDAVHDAARQEFTEAEIAHLVWTVVVINAYNRLAVSARVSPALTPSGPDR